MITLRNITILAVLGLWLAGCASPSTKVALVEALPSPSPSYDEKVLTQTLAQVKGPACPADSKWQTLQWKAVIPFANACVQAKDWNRVEKIGQFLSQRAYLTPWGPYYLSLSSEARRDYPRAVWMLELALKKDPGEGLFHYELGRVHWELHEDEEALRHLKLASDLSPSLTQAHWVMGEMAMRRQDYSAAESSFKKALASDSKHLPSLLALASLKINSKNWAEGEGYLNQALALNPTSGKTRLMLAQIQEEHLKKLPDALKNYRQLKHLMVEKKLTEMVDVNLDEKIQVLEKSLAQAHQSTPQVRTPSAERVSQ